MMSARSAQDGIEPEDAAKNVSDESPDIPPCRLV